MKIDKIKKVILFTFVFLFCANMFGASKQSSQIIKSGHWIYDDLILLSAENKTNMFLETQPLSIGEIKLYLKDIDYDNLSNSGKVVFDRVWNYINDDDDFIQNNSLRLYLNLIANPEFYYKSNPDINWTFTSHFKDNPLTFPVIIGFSDLFTIESDFIFSLYDDVMAKPDNFMNLSLNVGDYEMYITRFAYLSTAKVFDDWGFSAHMGKEGMKIGNTSLGSILYNDTFVSDFYCQLNLFTKYLKFTMDVTQFDNEKYMYIHELTMKPFKNFSIGVLEGSLIQAPFELRYLNPLMIMHQMEAWRDYNPDDKAYYSESNFCAYLGFTFEYLPIKNLRIYGLYAQNEIIDFGTLVSGDPSPSSLSWPNSIGAQLGAEYFIPLENSSYLKTRLEAVYTSPYLYVKHSPRWSLIKTKRSGNDSAMQSWLGSPMGPDSFAIQTGVEYDSNKNWSVGFTYNFKIHGENTADNLFAFNSEKYKPVLKEGRNPDSNKLEDYYWTYYPSTRYDHGDQAAKDAAVEDATNMWMHGTPEYKNELIVNGHYKVLHNLDLSAQFAYTFVFNNKNKYDNFAQGVELAIAATYNLF